MYTFKYFLEQRLLTEIGPPPAAGSAPPPPPPGGGGLGAPGGLPGGPPPGGGAPPPPMGGGMGGPPPMGGAPGAPGGGGQPAKKLQAYNVWDVLEKVLGGDEQHAQHGKGQEKGQGQKPQQQLQG